MIRRLLLAVVVVQLAGCFQRHPTTRGAAFDGKSTPIATTRRLDHGTRVILQGTMIEKCPEAGCWFIVRDGSGQIKVDTKDAGFVVVDVPLHVSLAVSGQVTTNGIDRILKATGLRY